jgi:hypothetical protein
MSEPCIVKVSVPATQAAVCGSLNVSTVAVLAVRVSVLTQSPLVSCALVAPATNVNVMLLVSPTPGLPSADMVAVPDQVPANGAGMVAPPAVAVLLGLGLGRLLGLALTLGLGLGLLLPEVLAVPAGLTEALVVPVTADPAADDVDGLRVSNSAATTATATTATATPLRAAIRPLDHRDDRTGGVIPVGVY